MAKDLQGSENGAEPTVSEDRIGWAPDRDVERLERQLRIVLRMTLALLAVLVAVSFVRAAMAPPSYEAAAPAIYRD